MQTVGIADQNGGENVANANRLRACFSYKCSQGGKNKLKVTPDAVSIKQLKMIFKLIKTKFWFAFYYCFFPKEHHSSLSNSFQLSVSSRFIYFVISSQNMSCSLPPNCLLFNLLHSHHFQLQNTAYSTDLCSSSSIFHALQERWKHIFLHFLPFCSKNSYHFFQKIKTILIFLEICFDNTKVLISLKWKKIFQ